MEYEVIQNLFAERIGGKSFVLTNEIFKFEKIKRSRRKAEKEHPERKIIDLGIGEPDEKADCQIIKTLYQEANKKENRGYADNGILKFQSAAAVYMEQVYSVRGLNPEKEILHCIGSKSAFAMLPSAFINPGDVTLMTVPGYPIIGTKTEWLGGDVYPLKLKKERNYLPDLTSIPESVLKRAKIFYLNYPNNPTGAIATEEFYKEVIEFAKKNHLVVVQDAAYAALTFGGRRPFSFLSIPGAKEVGIEIHSLSKAYNMTGWRLGFMAGNEAVIRAMAAVKDQNDSGQFKAIQHAGVYALSHPEITKEICKKYERRHEKLWKVLQTIGFDVETPKATFYEYVKIPQKAGDGTRFHHAEEFADYLIQKAMISTVPWDDAGAYIRLSVTFDADTEKEEDHILMEIQRRLSALGLVFE